MNYNCKVSTIKPFDFDMKWKKWLEEVHNVPNRIRIVDTKEEDFGKIISFYFDSVANTEIFAQLYLRNKSNGCIAAYYHGFNSNIEDPNIIKHAMDLVNGGLDVIIMDMRFQKGRIIDNNIYSYNTYPSACFNIDDLENCYCKRLDQDALKLIDIIKDSNCFKEIAFEKIIVTGPSQGGGLSLMVASMVEEIFLVVCDIPSDCAIKDRIINHFGKYGAILNFFNDHPELKDVILSNHDYFDVINMVENIKCPVYSSIGLLDKTCPPEYYYQAYKKINTEKILIEYEGYGHGGFEEFHLPKKIAFINDHLNK